MEGARLLAERGQLTGSHPSVMVTFSLAFKQVEDRNRAAADLVRACVFLAPDSIPEDLFLQGGSELGDNVAKAAASRIEFLRAVQEAGRFSLIERDPANKTLTIHRLVQTVVKEDMGEATRRQWAERIVKAVNIAFPSVKVSNWHKCEQWLPHAQVCAGLIAEWNLSFPEAARLLNQTGFYLQERARFAEAEPHYLRALAIRERVLGPDHPDVGISLNNLAELYRLQGRYAEAEPRYQRALAIWERVLGPDHPNVAQGLDNLAALYQAQGRYAEAEPRHQRALAIRERVLGPDHPVVALSLNNLAALYQAQGRYAEAEPHYQRALAIWERVLGPDHPNVAACLQNYAALLRSMPNRQSEAAGLKARAQAIRNKYAQHPE